MLLVTSRINSGRGSSFTVRIDAVVKALFVCCRTMVSGVGADDIDTSHVRTYQVYRGMSPTTSNRLEVRVGRSSQLSPFHFSAASMYS